MRWRPDGYVRDHDTSTEHTPAASPAPSSVPEAHGATLPRRVPPATAVLVLALWAVFALESLRKGGPGSARVLFAFGGTTSLTLADREFWRLVASCFVHAGIAHVASNTLVLLTLGSACEPLYGRLRFLALYLAAGVGGAVATVLSYGPEAVGVGASGALYGVLAAFLIGLWRDRRSWTDERGEKARDVALFVLVVLVASVLGALDPHISLAGHAGGFITGIALAIAFALEARRDRPVSSAGADAGGGADGDNMGGGADGDNRDAPGSTLGVGILLGVAALMLTVFNPHHSLPGDQANTLARASVGRINRGDYRGAIADDTRALRLDPGSALAHDFRGLALLHLGDARAALADFNRAIELNPADPYSYFRRALARLRLQDWRGASADDTRALRLYPKFADAYFDRGVARIEIGDRRGAGADMARAASLYAHQHNAAGYRRARLVLNLLTR